MPSRHKYVICSSVSTPHRLSVDPAEQTENVASSPREQEEVLLYLSATGEKTRFILYTDRNVIGEKYVLNTNCSLMK